MVFVTVFNLPPCVWGKSRTLIRALVALCAIEDFVDDHLIGELLLGSSGDGQRAGQRFGQVIAAVG